MAAPAQFRKACSALALCPSATTLPFPPGTPTQAAYYKGGGGGCCGLCKGKSERKHGEPLKRSCLCAC